MKLEIILSEINREEIGDILLNFINSYEGGGCSSVQGLDEDYQIIKDNLREIVYEEVIEDGEEEPQLIFKEHKEAKHKDILAGLIQDRRTIQIKNQSQELFVLSIDNFGSGITMAAYEFGLNFEEGPSNKYDKIIQYALFKEIKY